MPPIRGTKRFSLVAGASILWFHHRNLDEIPKSHSLIFDPGLKDVEGGSSIAGLCLKRTFSENTSWNGLRDLGQMCVCLKILYIYLYIYPCKSEGQVLRGLLQKTKFYEVPWFTWFYRAQPFFPSMLNLTWTPFETVDAWLGSIQSPTDHSPEWAFPSCNEQPLRLTFRSICKANSWRFPSRNYMFGRNFHTEKMVPRVSRSVHARFTVIVGLLPVIVGLLPVIVGPVHARFTLAILDPW